MSQIDTGAAELPYGRFFLPGPTEVHPDVLGAQTRAMISHRGPEIKTLMAELQEGLAEAFVTERPVFISTSSATGLMEAAVRNAGRTKILSLVNGAFSKRFADIGRACGFEVDEIEVPWGEAHDPAAVTERLAAGGYDAVTMAHSETSTSVLNDIRAIAAAVRAFDDVLVLVDSVSGFGAAEARPDEWGIDFYLTGSQKAFALPLRAWRSASPSEKMLERAEDGASEGVTTSISPNSSSGTCEKHQSPSTPADLGALRAPSAAQAG